MIAMCNILVTIAHSLKNNLLEHQKLELLSYRKLSSDVM